MRSVSSPAKKRTVGDLLAAAKALNSSELREFKRQLAEWGGDAKHHILSNDGDQQLLSRIRDNTALSKKDQRRFECLRAKRQLERLNKDEQQELQRLWQQVEQMNVARLSALVELAHRRGESVRTLMAELGIKENADVF